MYKEDQIEYFKSAYLNSTIFLGGLATSDPFLKFSLDDEVMEQFNHLKNKKHLPYHLFVRVLNVLLFNQSVEKEQELIDFGEKLILLVDDVVSSLTLSEEVKSSMSPDDAKSELELRKILLSAEELFYIFVLGIDAEPNEEVQKIAGDIVSNEECLENLSLVFQSWKIAILKD
jgi:hypothetical protein